MGLQLKQKIVLLAGLAAIIPVVLIVSLIFFQKGKVNVSVGEEMDKLGRDNVAQIARDVYSLIEITDKQVKLKVASNLKVAEQVLNLQGGVSLSNSSVSWEAINQYTKASETVELRKMLLGGNWLGQNRDINVTTKFVDEIAEMCGGTVTIFQRMNDKGDMLRVATNVEKLDNTRAIGTYIPKTNPDGKPNPVLTKVLAGETYNGIAYVVNAWYITSYKPIFDNSKNIIGVLYVGVKQESLGALRQAIMNTTVGKTGYVYVLGGKGNQAGHYVISKGGARDGEDINGAKDADGRLFIQDIVKQATQLKDGQIEYTYYPWLNKGEDKPRNKVVALAYYEEWDWIVGAGTYEDDFYEARTRVSEALASMILVSSVASLIILIVIVIVAFTIGSRIANPVKKIADTAIQIAHGDITQEVDIYQKDEVGQLADSFREMSASLQMLARGAQEIAQGNLVFEMEAKSEDDVLGIAMIKMRDELINIIGEIATTSSVLASSAEELSAVSTQLSSGAEENSSMVTTVAASAEESSSIVGNIATMTEEWSATVKGIATNAVTNATDLENVVRSLEESTGKLGEVSSAVEEMKASINEVAQGMEEARRVSDQANNMAAGVNTSMEEHAEVVKQVAKVVDTIKDIADQTNMLALNATIEAAGAGEAGKGFAVVASEVKDLARQSADAASDIGEQITNMLGTTREVIDSISNITNVIKEVADINGTVAAAITQQNATVSGIAMSVNETAMAANDVTGVARETSNSVTEISRAAGEAANTSEEVAQNVAETSSTIQEIATAIEKINSATSESAKGISQVNDSAGELSSFAVKLKDIVNRFTMT